MALGAKGSACDRLTPYRRVEGSALGRYIVSLRWRGGRLRRQFLYRLWRRKPYNRPGALWGLRVQRVVLSRIPEGACACGAEGRMASIGPPALGAKGCAERLHPTGETTHYDLCVAGAPANHVRCASLRSGGRRLAVRKTIEYQIGALPRTPFPATRDFPSRGNESVTGFAFLYHMA